MNVVSLCFQETQPCSPQPCYLTLTLSLPCLPWCSQVLGVHYLIDVSAGNGYPRISCFLHFDQLWLFKIVSEKFIKKGKIQDRERASGLRESTRFLALSLVPPSYTGGFSRACYCLCVFQGRKEVSVFVHWALCSGISHNAFSGLIPPCPRGTIRLSLLVWEETLGFRHSKWLEFLHHKESSWKLSFFLEDTNFTRLKM